MSTVGRLLLPLRIPPEVLEGGQAPPHDPHRFTGAELQHLAPRSGWGSDPHGPIYYKGRYHMFYQACHASCQWWWGLHWEHCVSEDLVNWVRLPPAIMPTPGWLDSDGCFTGNIRVDPKTGTPTLFYTGARLRHNPAAAQRHPDPPRDACNPLMLHWETQLCAVADPNDELLLHWTKVAAPWMELPHCAYLTAWRDPFFVPPELDPKTGQPLPGQECHLQVPPAIAYTPHVLPEEPGANGDTEAKVPAAADSPFSFSTPQTTGTAKGTHVDDGPGVSGQHTKSGQGPRVLKDGDSFIMLIGSGLEGVGGTALVYRSQELHKGWQFDGYLCTWPNLQTGLCWECPHLLNLPDLPDGLHCLVSRTNPSFLPATDPAELEGKRARQERLAAMAGESLDTAALEVAKMGIAAQILQEAEQAQAEHEAAAEAAKAKAEHTSAAAHQAATESQAGVELQAVEEGVEQRHKEKVALQTVEEAGEQRHKEEDAAHCDAALASAAALTGTGSALSDSTSPSFSLAVSAAKKRQEEDMEVALPQPELAAENIEEGIKQAAAFAASQLPPGVLEEQQNTLQGAIPESQLNHAAPVSDEDKGRLDPAEGSKLSKAAASTELNAQEEGALKVKLEGPSPIALAASGMQHSLPGELPQIGPAQTLLLSSLLEGEAEQKEQAQELVVGHLGVDALRAAAQKLAEQQHQGGAEAATPKPPPASTDQGPSPPPTADMCNPLFSAMKREVRELQLKRDQQGLDPHGLQVPVVLKKVTRKRFKATDEAHHPRSPRPVSPFHSPSLSPPGSPTMPSPPQSPFSKATGADSAQPFTGPDSAVSQVAVQGGPATSPPTTFTPVPFADLQGKETLGKNEEAVLPVAPATPTVKLPPLLNLQSELAATESTPPRPGAPEPPPTPPMSFASSTASLPPLAPFVDALTKAQQTRASSYPAAMNGSIVHPAADGSPVTGAYDHAEAPALPSIPDTAADLLTEGGNKQPDKGTQCEPFLENTTSLLERAPSLTAAASAALIPIREQYTRKVASVATATLLARDALTMQQSQEAPDAQPTETLEQAKSVIRDATISADDVKTAVEASMAGLGISGVVSTSEMEGAESPYNLASSIQAKITAGVQQQQQQQLEEQQQQQQQQQNLNLDLQEEEQQRQEGTNKKQGQEKKPELGQLEKHPGSAVAEQALEADYSNMLQQAMSLGQKQALKDVAKLQEATEEKAKMQSPNQGVIASASKGEARLAGETMPAAQRRLPEPPQFDGEVKPSVEEIRAACRAYAEAAAAAQGFDLGMPSTNSRVVRQVAEGPPAVAEPAGPGQRWFLGIAPDAATYGILYFLGDFKNGRFDLEGSTGPYKLDIGNVLYAPVAFYDQKVGRVLVWGYLKELWQLSPPPAMCNKFCTSGGVSLPRTLYLKAGKLYQVPIPEMAELRQKGKCFSMRNVLLTPEEPLVVPGPGEAGGLDRGDHVDIELVIRRGTAARTSLLLDSWRPNGRGAAALVFDWNTKQLKIVYKAYLQIDQWSSATAVDAQAADKAARAAKEEGTHWVQDPTALLADKNLYLKGGRHAVSDEDGAVYDVFTDAKTPPVADMNPLVPDWIRMDRGRAGGTLDMCNSDPLELRIFIDGSAVEIFTGTGQVLSTRVYRGAPDFSTQPAEGGLAAAGASEGQGTVCGGTGTSAQPKADLSPAAVHGVCTGTGGARLQLLAVGGSCEIERAEFHQTRSIWLRGQADAPLPPPVSPEALELWKADAQRAAGFAQEAAQAEEEIKSKRS